MKVLAGRYKLNVCSKNGKDRTPLHSAASNGHLETVKLLIEELEADVEVEDGVRILYEL